MKGGMFKKKSKKKSKKKPMEKPMEKLVRHDKELEFSKGHTSRNDSGRPDINFDEYSKAATVNLKEYEDAVEYISEHGTPPPPRNNVERWEDQDAQDEFVWKEAEKLAKKKVLVHDAPLKLNTPEPKINMLTVNWTNLDPIHLNMDEHTPNYLIKLSIRMLKTSCMLLNKDDPSGTVHSHLSKEEMDKGSRLPYTSKSVFQGLTELVNEKEGGTLDTTFDKLGGVEALKKHFGVQWNIDKGWWDFPAIHG